MADFADVYGIRLHTRPRMSWAEFRDLVFGLLQADTRLWRATRPPAPEDPAADVMPDWANTPTTF